MEQGANEEFLIDQARKAKAPIPDKILDKPVLTPGLDFYYNAFNNLCSDRQVGMGVGPIPWSSIDRYAARYDLDEEEFEVFHFYMRKMDHAFIQQQQTKKAMGQKAAKKPDGLAVREKGKRRGEG